MNFPYILFPTHTTEIQYSSVVNLGHARNLLWYVSNGNVFSLSGANWRKGIFQGYFSKEEKKKSNRKGMFSFSCSNSVFRIAGDSHNLSAPFLRSHLILWAKLSTARVWICAHGKVVQGVLHLSCAVHMTARESVAAVWGDQGLPFPYTLLGANYQEIWGPNGPLSKLWCTWCNSRIDFPLSAVRIAALSSSPSPFWRQQLHATIEPHSK